LAAPRAAIGLNRLGLLLLGLNVAVLLLDVALYASAGMTIAWPTAIRSIALQLLLFVVWLNFYLIPGRPRELFVAELVFILLQIVLLTNGASLLQYGAVAVGAPYADWWLAKADAALGVHVPTLAAWTFAHPTVKTIFDIAYFSFMPQIFAAVGILAWYRDRERLWEFAFHFHVCLIVSVLALIPFPAVCTQAYYGFQPTIDMSHLIGQIKQLHAGQLHVVRFDELEGLVSLPSFHVAGALATTWAVRGRRWWFPAFAALNVVLVLSTFVTGVHYLVDVLASFPLFAASVVLFRWRVRSLVTT
jgi:hypothetical protein